jgi:flagellar protein FlaG
MTRIEASVATQVGDAIRPRQAVRDTQLQSDRVRSAALTSADSGGEELSADDLRAVAQQFKQVVEAASGRQLNFDIDEKSKQTYVSITDSKTGEVIRQIPTQEMRKLKAQIDEMIGLLFDEQA